MKDNKIKVAFLFGAGAEGIGNYGICNGLEFTTKILFGNNYFTKELKKYFKDDYFCKTYKYRADKNFQNEIIFKNFLIKKSCNNTEFFEKHTDTIRFFLGKDINKIISEISPNDCETESFISERNKIYKNEKNIADDNDIKLKKYKDNIINEFIQSLKGEMVKMEIKNDFIKDLLFDIVDNEDGKPKIDFNIALSGILDSYFHTVISPGKYSKINFSKVINFYWNCYFIILYYVLKYLNNEKFNACFENEELDYNYILKNLKNITNELYETQIPTNNTYYDFISEKIKKNNKISCNGVITTNYYRFCETIPATVIYLNGQLKNFEFPETLDVLDLTQDEIPKEKLFFPFIFGQSLIKPIVNSKQTEEFHKLYKLLLDENNNDNSTDVLVILGYNINEDDNHINSFLHEFASKKDKRVIIVTNKESDAHLKLKCDKKKIEYCKVEYLDSSVEHNAADYADKNREIVDKIFDKILMIDSK